MSENIVRKTSKEKRNKKQTVNENLQSKYNFMERQPLSDKVKERFERKPYGKIGEKKDFCNGCFGAANGDCQKCPHKEEKE